MSNSDFDGNEFAQENLTEPNGKAKSTAKEKAVKDLDVQVFRSVAG